MPVAARDVTRALPRAERAVVEDTMLFSEMNDAFRMLDALERRLDAGRNERARGGAARVGLRDDGEALLLVAELPGVRLDEVEVLLETDVLTLRASRRRSLPEGARLVRAERPEVQLVRQIELPTRVDADAVTASMRDGVLQVRLPKAAEARPRRIPIAHASSERPTN